MDSTILVFFIIISDISTFLAVTLWEIEFFQYSTVLIPLVLHSFSKICFVYQPLDNIYQFFLFIITGLK